MTERPTDRRPWTWLAWLALFLALELPSALSQKVRRHWVTLSETVPRWYPTKARFLLFAQFGLVLLWHLYGMVAMSLGEPGHWYWSAQVIAASGALAASSIGYAELWERRGLVGLIDDVKLLLKLKAVRDRLKEASKMGRLRAVALALGGAVLTGFVAQVTGACPTIMSSMPAILLAGVGGLIAGLTRKPATSAGTKALVIGAASAGLAGVVEQLNQICGPGFVDKLPALATAGIVVGIGVFLNPVATKKADDLGSVTPPSLKG